MHDNTLTQDNREKFVYLAGQYNQLVKFYNVEELCPDKLQEYVNLFPAIKDLRYTVAAFYRLLIPQLFSSEIHKVIYLDSDIIVNLDINELWQIKLQDKALAAVPEVKIANNPSGLLPRYLVKSGFVAYEDYFNSGVLVMNLKKLRQIEDQIVKGIKWCNERPCHYPDQDILNYVFSKDYLKLDEKFDCFISKARNSNRIYDSIYHYLSGNLTADISDPFNRLWFDYFCKTPWFDVNVIGNFKKYIDELNRELGQRQKDFLIKFSAALSGKSRVFVIKGNKAIIDWLKKAYFIRDNEEIFVIEDEESLPQLIEEMKTSRDKKLFFIRVEELIRPLKEAGFVEERDFFNHRVLFSPNLFSKKDVYSLLKAM